MVLESLPGSVLDQKYRIDHQLGKGAMGAVFQATHLGTMRTVALKVIVPKLAAQVEFSQRFKREAEAAGRLRHPNVVNVTDFGVTQVEDGNLAYMVMEYLDGQTLTAYLKRDPRPSFDFILDVVDQTALALDAAHAVGIVHRDLKPSNIWLEPDGRGGYNVKVLDFGIAKVSDRAAGAAPRPSSDDDETIVMMRAAVAMAVSAKAEPALPSLLATPSHLETTVGTLLGTPAYMAPEQCQGSAVDYRADIYSLATIAYEMLCSRLPFQAEEFTELVRMQIDETPRSPREQDDSVPAALSEAVMSGLAKDPASRPKSAGAFAARLRSVAEGEFTLIRKSKDIFHTHTNRLLPLLPACLAPAVALILLVWAGAHLAFQMKAAPPLILIAVLVLASIGWFVFGLQLYKAGCCLVLRRASATGQFGPILRPVLFPLMRGLPALLRTQLVSLLQWSPTSFRDNLLWPVVWAAEGQSGRAAIDRSRQLCRTLPGAARGLMLRQYGPPVFGMLLFPAMMVLMVGPNVIQVIVREVLAGSGMGFLLLLYPLVFVIIYGNYGSACSFLYESALLCRGESGDIALQAAARDDKRRRRPAIRPSTLLWMGVPALLLAIILVKGNMSDNAAALEAALDDGRRGAVVKALDSGLSADYRISGRKETPLFNAIRTGDAKLTEVLLSRGANVNVRNRDGVTPLLLAVIQRRDDLARLLLDHGAAVDAADSDGHTALIQAAMRGNLPMVQLLIERRADRKLPDAHGKTALAYAREEGYPQIEALLQR